MYQIKLTDGEIKTLFSIAHRYQSAHLLVEQSEWSENEVMIDDGTMYEVFSVLRDQMLTVDSGLSDPDNKHEKAMIPLLSADLCNRIFDEYDPGFLPREVSDVTLVFGHNSNLGDDELEEMDKIIYEMVAVPGINVMDFDVDSCDIRVDIYADNRLSLWNIEQMRDRIQSKITEVQNDNQ